MRSTAAGTWARRLRALKLPRRRAWPPLWAVVILGAFFFLGIAGPHIVPYDPVTIAPGERFEEPIGAGGTLRHPLGTDQLGRDLFSRMVAGTRTSMLVAALTILLTGGIGVTLGAAAGYLGGAVDAVIGRLIDAMMALPTLLVAILFSFLFGAGLENLVIVLGLLLWSRIARLVRASAITVSKLTYIESAKAVGSSELRILARHVLPNLMHTAVVATTLWIGQVIIIEASLSFLGAGIPPPTPSWGILIADGRRFILVAWWLAVLPGIPILLVVLAFNTIGDWLRDITDPKLRNALRPEAGP